MARPQKENGYTPIANEILEAVYARKLSATQYRILMIIWRYTYGYNRKSAPIAQSFIARATDTHISSVRREMAKLIRWKIINVITPAGFNKAQVLEFNKNYEEWDQAQLARELPPSAEASSIQNGPDTASVDATLKKKDKANILLQQPRAYARFYAENIGLITPTILTEAESYIEDGMTDEVISLALKESVDAGAKNWKYAKAVLTAWLDKGIFTAEQAKAANREFQNRRRRLGMADKKDFEQREYTPEDLEKRKADNFAELERMYGNGI